jgi:polyhydroxybutyrate depolymerase
VKLPVLLLLTPLLPPAAELVPQTIEVGGLLRTYRYYAPPNRAGKLPLVFVLHGAGGDGERVARTTRFEQLAAKVGFIVVYPDGFEKHWNDLRGIPEWTAQQRNIDDVGFFSALIDRFVSQHHADAKRVFVAGISNGGLMSHRLGCELANKIAAIAPVVRTLTHKLADGCRPARAISVLMFFGTADKLVPFEGGIQKMGSVGTPVLSARQTIEKWARLNRCASPPSVTPTTEPAGSREAFGNCRDGVEVMAYIREGAGHAWPPDATELIWAFFEKHPMR